jgi:hypothetical protein
MTPIVEPYAITSTGVELRWNRFMPDQSANHKRLQGFVRGRVHDAPD